MTPFSTRLSAVALCFGGLLASLALPAFSDAGMPQAELTIGMYRIVAEVAATQEDRMRGLMQRKSMPPSRGIITCG